MAGGEFRKPAGDDFLPDQFAKGENEQCFADGEKKSSDNVARPMRAKINSRIGDGRSDDPIELPPAPIKNRAANRDHGVVVGVARWKGCTGAGAFRCVWNTNVRFLETGQGHGTRV